MTYKSNINEASRVVYYADSVGSDDFDGHSIETPKATPQGAIDTAAALIPAPQLASPVRVKEAQGGVFVGDVVLAEFVLFEATQTALVTTGVIGVTAASNISFNCQGVIGTAPNSVGLLIDGNVSFGGFINSLQGRGTNSQLINITGSVDDLFIEAKQVLADADSICCFRVDASSPTPIDINCDTVILNSTNGTFLEWNQPGVLDVGAVQVTSIAGVGTGSKAIHLLPTNAGSVSCYCHIMQGDILCEGGGLVLDALVIDGDITVRSGATVTIKSVGVLQGNITVDVGGVLFIEVDNHISGTVTNNGTIKGRIDGVQFGDITILDNLIVDGELSVGTATPDASALLQIDSTVKGFLPPRMTTAERDLISTPATGLVVYNTTTNKIEVYNGTIWEGVAGPDEFTGLTDTPASYTGQALKITRVNSGETDLEFTDTPILTSLTIDNVGAGANPVITSNDSFENLNISGSLEIEDKLVIGTPNIGMTLDSLGNIITTNSPGEPLFLSTAGDADIFFSDNPHITSTVHSYKINSVSVLSNNTLGGGVLASSLTSVGTLVDLVVGTTVTPDGTVHIHTASAGSIGSTSSADDLTIENSADAGITILTPDANISALNFGSPNRQTGAFIRWQNSTQTFNIGTGDTNAILAFDTGLSIEAMRLLDTGELLLGGTSLDGSALFQMDSTTQGFLAPRMTTTQKLAIPSPATGLTVYDTDLSDYQIFDGASWNSVAGGDVSGPASSTDNAVARFNGPTGKNIQNSGVIVSDDNTLLADNLRQFIENRALQSGTGTIEIGSFDSGGFNLNVSLSIAESGIVINQYYTICTNFVDNDTWVTVIPSYNSGIFQSNEIGLEAKQNGNILHLRIRRLAGTNGGDVFCHVVNRSDLTTSFTPSSVISTDALPSGFLPEASLTQRGGKVGILTLNPAAELEVVGEILISGDGTLALTTSGGDAELSTTNDGDIDITPDGLGRTKLGVDFTPGVDWVDGTPAVSKKWTGITFGNGLFVAVASDSAGATDLAMFSTNGIDWTSGVTPSTIGDWVDVAFGAGVFCAVCQGGGTEKIMTSPDAITWTLRTPSAGNTWKTVAFGNGVFVVLSFSGVSMTSPDGINWTTQSCVNRSWRSVTFGNGIFVAVAQSGTGDRVMSSTDGLTWFARTTPQDNVWSDVTFGNNLFVAVAQDGTNRVMTSPDGVIWIARAAAGTQDWRGVDFSNGIFVAVSSDAAPDNVMTSTDGITWSLAAGSSDGNWQKVACTDGIFAAIGQIGTRLMTSGTAEKNQLRGDFNAENGFTVANDVVAVLDSNVIVISQDSEWPHYFLENTRYLVTAPITVAAGDESIISNLGNITIESTDRINNTVTYTGTTGTLFSADAITGSLLFQRINFTGNGNSSRMMNLVASGFPGMFMDSCNINNWGSVSELDGWGGGIAIGKIGGSGNVTGIFNVINSVFFGVENCFFQNFFETNSNFFTIDSLSSRIAMTLTGVVCQPGENVFLINSSFTGEVIVTTEFGTPEGQLFDSAGLDGTSIFVDVNNASNQPDSTVAAELFLSGNTATTDIPAAGAMVEMNNDVNWTDDVERMTISTDGVTEYIGLSPIRMGYSGNINLEPANASKSISIKTVLIAATGNTVTFTNASNLINETATALSDGDSVSFRDTAGTLPAEIRADVVYFVVSKLANSFQVAYTSGGSAIAFTDDGTPTNSYKVATLQGATPTNTITASGPRDLIPQATVTMVTSSKAFLVVINNDDAVDIMVNSGYQRYSS